MAYTPTYVVTDTAPITIDIVNLFLAALAGQMGTIAQLIVLGIILGLVGGLIGLVAGFFGLIKGFGKR
jgi:hypothetical protein